ncbi:nitroreductase family protein [Niabella ginsengisoli]|uniref:Nitroreductase family protein n=1 Tax=Niabella ginsengisoli TaxID=522298 RepID=A0ABS9SP14_9BACT|nr:nitroreductase family protein [Niabella ginsengisoli]MCH5600080.1 nitroreductase family protein [Niabella ginsengisoli]
MAHVKIAQTEFPVLDIIKERWSPRAFADKAITEQDIHTILEAGSWAASANNEQPWKYVYAMKGTPGFEKLWNCLTEGNQSWNKHAAVLMVAITRKTFVRNGKDNKSAEHDLGMSNAHMFLQAVSMDIYPHPMGGFFPDKVKGVLSLTDDEKPVCMIGWGYLGNPEMLDEKNKVTETQARSRKHHTEFSEKYKESF